MATRRRSTRSCSIRGSARSALSARRRSPSTFTPLPRPLENGFFIGGCVFDEVKPEMRIYKEEIFGPVLSVVRADTFDEATTLVSDHEYGNGAAIFTRDGDAAREFANRAQIGMIGVNVPIP